MSNVAVQKRWHLKSMTVVGQDNSEPASEKLTASRFRSRPRARLLRSWRGKKASVRLQSIKKSILPSFLFNAD